MGNNNELVHIFMVTYNHKKYIAKAIESVLMQKTNFAYKLIIGEDCSTDGTRQIVKDYSNNYTNKITAFLNEKNLGIRKNSDQILEACTAKYMALIEGDDYWTDPLKLQKQVDFLEANPKYSLCFHDALIIWDDKSQSPKHFCSKNQKETSTIEDIIKNWFIPSASMVFRKEYITPLPDWFKDIYNGDYALHLLLADKGKIKYINKVMSVYRKNENSLSGKYNTLNNLRSLLKLFNLFNAYSKYRYKRKILKRVLSLRKQIVIQKIKK